MSLPQFTAEASLGRASGLYRGTAAGSGAGAGDVLPMQLGGIGFPVIRCCRWAPLFRRFVCTSRQQRPWEQCRCVATQTGPVFLCKDNEITQSQF